MLKNLADLLTPAREQGYGVACFNVFGYEDALAVVQAAEKRNASVILSINLDMREFMSLESIAGMLLPLAESSSAPVCLHLDHTYDAETVKKAVDYGFTSVMYDCSQKSIEENIEGIRDVVAYAKAKNVSVEAEVGSVPYATGRDHIKSELTAITEALAMEAQAQPDAIAISVGNVHRIENAFVDIDFEHFDKLMAAVKTPMVIHGTSGIRHDEVQQLAKKGICKFNIGTCLRQSFGNSARKVFEEDDFVFDRLEIMKQVVPGMTDEAEKMIVLLGQ